MSKVRIKFNKLPRYAREFPVAVDAAVRELAFNVHREALNNLELLVYSGPEPTKTGYVRTGALRNSLYVRTSKDDAMQSAISSARAANTNVPIGSEPAFTRRLGSAQIGVAVEYGVFIEYGTRFNPAKPFLGPAIESLNTQKVVETIRKHVGRIGK